MKRTRGQQILAWVLTCVISITMLWENSMPAFAATVSSGDFQETVTVEKGEASAAQNTTVSGNEIIENPVLKAEETKISLDTDNLVIKMGDTYTLVASVTPAEAAKLGVTWKSSNPKVATVTDGKITPVSFGKTVIQAMTKDAAATASCTVSVVPEQVPMESVSVMDYETLLVSWTPLTGVSGYEILRSTTPNGIYEKIGTVTGAGTDNFADTGVTLGTTYYYKVCAYAGTGSAKVYGENSVYKSNKTRLSKVELTGVTSQTYQTIKIEWKRTAGADGYEIYRASGKNGTYSKIKTITAGSTVSYTDKKVTVGKKYYYKVCAYKKVKGMKVYGEKSSAKGRKHILGAVAIQSGVSTGYNKITLKWNKITGANGYQIYRASGKNGSYKKIKTITKGSTVSYTNTGLQCGAAYYYKIRAYRRVSGKAVVGAFSAPMKIKAIPAAVSLTGVKSTAYNQIKVTWQKSPEADGYRIYRATSKKGTYKAVKTITNAELANYIEDTTKPNVLSYVNSSLKCGTPYFYKVRAYKIVGTARVYGNDSVIKREVPKPNKVKIKSIESPSTTALTLKWDKIDGAGGYEIYRSTSKSGGYSLVGSVAGKSNVTYTDTKLTCGTGYYYKVRAYASVKGSKVYGSYSSVKVSQAKPAMPKLLSVKVSGAAKITLKWEQVAGAEGYQVYRKAQGDTWENIKTIKGRTGMFTDSTAAMGVTYTYSVRAYCKVSGKTVYGDYNKTGLSTVCLKDALYVNGTPIILGESEADFLKKFGEPDRKDATPYNFTYYVYNKDLSHLTMVGIKDGAVVAFYTDAEDFFYGSYSANQALGATEIVNKANASKQYGNLTIDLLTDTFNANRLYGIQILGGVVMSSSSVTADILNAAEKQVFDLTNSFRARHKIPLLKWSDTATACARAHSKDMADNNYFASTSKTGVSYGQRMTNAGIKYQLVAENIAAANVSGIGTVNQWINKGEYRTNMLNGSLKYAGIGSAYNTGSMYKYYYTQDFYTP